MVERLGAESHLIFPVDAAKPAGEAAAAAEEATEDDDATLLADDDRARFTAVEPGRRRFTPGDAVELVRPAEAVHLFDPETGVGAAVTIPPLAGLFGYGEASRAGMPVERSAACLWRLAYAYRRLHALAVELLPRTPEWEVKCALGLRVWLDAEHAAAFERRVNELRHPSVDARDAPDPALAAVFDELAHARDTGELLAAGDLVVRGALLGALETYLATANPLADHPSVRLVEAALRDEQRRAAWSGAAAAAVPCAGNWPGTVAALLDAAGGLLGDGSRADPPAGRGAVGGRAAGARPGGTPRRRASPTPTTSRR